MLVALVLRDLEPADPAAFKYGFREWRTGDEFRAGQNLQPFRIVAMVEEAHESDLALDAVWIVEPVESPAETSTFL